MGLDREKAIKGVACKPELTLGPSEQFSVVHFKKVNGKRVGLMWDWKVPSTLRSPPGVAHTWPCHIPHLLGLPVSPEPLLCLSRNPSLLRTLICDFEG